MSFFFDSENLFHWPYLWRTIWHARQSATPRLCFILQCLSVPAVLWRTRLTNRPWVSCCGVCCGWCCLPCRPADCYHEVVVHPRACGSSTWHSNRAATSAIQPVGTSSNALAMMKHAAHTTVGEGRHLLGTPLISRHVGLKVDGDLQILRILLKTSSHCCIAIVS